MTNFWILKKILIKFSYKIKNHVSNTYNLINVLLKNNYNLNSSLKILKNLYNNINNLIKIKNCCYYNYIKNINYKKNYYYNSIKITHN